MGKLIEKYLQFDGRSAVFAPYRSKCALCVHLDSIDFVCPAFPAGIPDRFLDGSADHTARVRGQKGDLVFSESSN